MIQTHYDIQYVYHIHTVAAATSDNPLNHDQQQQHYNLLHVYCWPILYRNIVAVVFCITATWWPGLEQLVAAAARSYVSRHFRPRWK